MRILINILNTIWEFIQAIFNIYLVIFLILCLVVISSIIQLGVSSNEIALVGFSAFALFILAWFNLRYFFFNLKRTNEHVHYEIIRGKSLNYWTDTGHRIPYIIREIGKISNGYYGIQLSPLVSYARFTKYFTIIGISAFPAAIIFAYVWVEFITPR